MGNCVMVARQILILFVWVRILVPQPQPRNESFSVFFLSKKAVFYNQSGGSFPPLFKFLIDFEHDAGVGNGRAVNKQHILIFKLQKLRQKIGHHKSEIHKSDRLIVFQKQGRKTRTE